MDNIRLRSIILNLQDRLSNDDRKRLHFYLGHDVPRRIRDDPTLGGTLALMDSLFDQDKINEQDFTYLIKTFDEIRCFDAVKLLKDHLRQNRENNLSQSMQSLSLIMPPLFQTLTADQEEEDDKLGVHSDYTHQQNFTDNHQTTINNLQMHRNDYKTQQSLFTRLKRSTLFKQCLFLLIVLSLIFWTQYEIYRLKNDSKSFQTRLQRLENQMCSKRIKLKKWKQDAQIVAGGNGDGNELNQLYRPLGISIDKHQNIFIADFRNNRIMKWKLHESQGQIIAGGNGTDQLDRPTDVIINEQNNSLIIADRGNRRVIQWFSENQQEILIENILCYGLKKDKFGFLYVSDWEKHEVRKWKFGEMKEKNGTLVAGGDGQGNKLTQFNEPHFIFVDDEQSVYVSDWKNHRVMKWRKDAKEGIVVAGGHGQGKNLSQLNHPQGIIVDDFGHVYVADSHNYRIMRWREGSTEGEIVVDGNEERQKSNQLSDSHGLSFDVEGNLYVADYKNSRIERFDIDRE
ncbi:unnamed protein product [Adineta ricciae]|uniref:DED domain-containing protein n=2 Tax=Adineta ricciae TaxID=249248 RepID=A0A816CH06_ADIRI|nr:unnamed protein product [Adineta ricciae]